MSTLSDVQALYGSVRDTWAKSYAHVVSHVVLAAVVFWIGRTTIPEVSVGPIDPKLLSESDWFKLAKDSGVIYASFVIPIVILVAYAALLRSVGRLLVFILMAIFNPSSRTNQYRLFEPPALEPIALAVQKEDFQLGDLQLKSSELALKYQSQKTDQWKQFQDSIDKLTKNSQIYLGDFLFFLLSWITLFKFLPHASWIRANEHSYWPVVFVLSILVWFAWFRVSRAIAFVPTFFLAYVSTMIRADPDMKTILEASEEQRENVRQKLEDLLRKERERVASYPSLQAFIRHKMGLQKRISAGQEMEADGHPLFPSLYREGARFSRDQEMHSQYDDRWVSKYCAYLYYRLHLRVYSLVRTMWQLTRYIVTGAP
jgi:hypothetical protein